MSKKSSRWPDCVQQRPKTSRRRDDYGTDPIEPGDRVVRSRGLPPTPPPGSAPRYFDFVRELVCSRQLVLVGKATQSRTLLNYEGTFFFTDYEVLVGRLIHSKAEGPPPPSGAVISVAVAGGHVRIAGIPTSAPTKGLLELGSEHLLFLDRIPGTAAFTPIGPSTPVGSKPAIANNRPVPEEISRGSVPFDVFVDQLEQARTSCRGIGR